MPVVVEVTNHLAQMLGKESVSECIVDVPTVQEFKKSLNPMVGMLFTETNVKTMAQGKEVVLKDRGGNPAYTLRIKEITFGA